MTNREFGEGDVGLLLEVLQAHQPLLSTAHAVRLVEAGTSYPIRHRGPIEKLFRGGDAIRVGPCTVTRDELRRELPETLFPVADRTELITKLVMAFMRGHLRRLEQLPLTGRAEGGEGI
jgi:hypothetical protein